MRKAPQMKDDSPDLWLGAGTLLLLVSLLLIFLRMRAIIPDNGLVTGLMFIPPIAGFICFTLSIIMRSRSKSWQMAFLSQSGQKWALPIISSIDKVDRLIYYAQ